jgi:hypothetical protein
MPARGGSGPGTEFLAGERALAIIGAGGGIHCSDNQNSDRMTVLRIQSQRGRA